jgi:hypothetical protein
MAAFQPYKKPDHTHYNDVTLTPKNVHAENTFSNNPITIVVFGLQNDPSTALSNTNVPLHLSH